MKLNSFLVCSRHGVYYLRIQRNGVDRRVSLRTKNWSEASLKAYRFGATICSMSKIPDQEDFDAVIRDAAGVEFSSESAFVEIVRGSAMIRQLSPERTLEVVALARAQQRMRELERNANADAVFQQLLESNPSLKSQQTLSAANLTPEQIQLILSRHSAPAQPLLKSICLRDAITEYLPFLDKNGGAVKSIKMAKVVLNALVAKLGADFPMTDFDDARVENLWLEPRRLAVAGSTAKKELSWVRGFSAWAAADARKYCSCALSLTVPDSESKNEHRAYFRTDDLRRIFDTLPTVATRPWHLWVPLIGLYTGARIGEPAALRTEHFFEKAGLQIMHLPGTKTDCAPRDVPIHPDLVTMGLLDLVAARRESGHAMLFDITLSQQNGFGAAPTKWFGAFLRDKVGISDKNKVFHSFRHTLVDHLRQHDASPEARMQYVGHSTGGSSHAMYGREPLGLPALQSRVVDKIDWQKYCGWTLDVDMMAGVAAALTAPVAPKRRHRG